VCVFALLCLVYIKYANKKKWGKKRFEEIEIGFFKMRLDISIGDNDTQLCVCVCNREREKIYSWNDVTDQKFSRIVSGRC